MELSPVCATVGLAVVSSALSFDTPVSHVILLNRLPVRPHSIDLEMQRVGTGTSSEALVRPEDDYFSALRRLWKVEGLQGFLKGFAPRLFGSLLTLVAEAAIDKVLHKIISSRRTGIWRLGNAALTIVLKNLAIAILVNPAQVLDTRLRLSPAERTCKQEVRYLFFRMNFTEWFSSKTILPSFARRMVFEAASTIMTILLPHAHAPRELTARELTANSGPAILESSIYFLLRRIVANLVAFPFLRCQELAAVSIKPLEQATVDLAAYDGTASEIVLDSAWDGLQASFQKQFLFDSVHSGLRCAGLSFLSQKWSA